MSMATVRKTLPPTDRSSQLRAGKALEIGGHLEERQHAGEIRRMALRRANRNFVQIFGEIASASYY